MANKVTNTQYYSDIASAIRSKNGSAATYTPSQMAGAIQSIPTGTTPSGILNITANGTYDVTNKASAVVAVPEDSKCWSFTIAENSGAGAVISIATDSWLLRHKDDPSLTIALQPLSSITLSDKYFVSCVQCNTSHYGRYGRSIRCGISSASLMDNNLAKPINSTDSAVHGFKIDGNGALTLTIMDAGANNLILPAGTYLVVAAIQGS